jgi:hypothetical protein
MRASGRRSRLLRVALFAVAWSMSGAWSLAHALEHAHHHESAPERLEVSAQPDDAHGHAHPEILPVALSGKGPQPVALVVLATAPESARGPSLWEPIALAAPPRPAPWTGGSSGPRAPPIA